MTKLTFSNMLTITAVDYFYSIWSIWTTFVDDKQLKVLIFSPNSDREALKSLWKWSDKFPSILEILRYAYCFVKWRLSCYHNKTCPALYVCWKLTPSIWEFRHIKAFTYHQHFAKTVCASYHDNRWQQLIQSNMKTSF